MRASTVRLLEHEYLITHADKSTLQWGLKSLWHGEKRLSLADPARTVIDILDSPRLGGGIRNCRDILAAYLDVHEPARLVEYGDRFGNRAVFKRLGYLLEAMHRPEIDLVEECHTRLSSGFRHSIPMVRVEGQGWPAGGSVRTCQLPLRTRRDPSTGDT